MEKYYVNREPQTNGDHEVHRENCRYVPAPGNRRYLGVYTSCMGAVAEAKKNYTSANGCYTCSTRCHTT